MFMPYQRLLNRKLFRRYCTCRCCNSGVQDSVFRSEIGSFPLGLQIIVHVLPHVEAEQAGNDSVDMQQTVVPIFFTT